MPETSQDQELQQDLEQKFGAGEASEVEGEMDYGLNRQRIPERYQNIFKDLAKKCAQRDMFARIEEVRKAGMQRFYWRGDFDVCYDDSNDSWAIPGGLGPWGMSGGQDASDVELHYPFNIYQAFGRGFISIVGQVPHVRMESAETFSPDGQKVSSAADALRRKIESQNHMEGFAEDVSRLFWTDGRVSLYSRWVTDGARFGYEEDSSGGSATFSGEEPEGVGEGEDPPQKQPRQAKGGECVDAYGVLECKVPINMRHQSQFMWRQLSYEIDETSAKAMYPWLDGKLKNAGGQPGPGEYNLDRTTRLATTQGVRLLTESGDTVQALLTWQRSWLRPSFFTEIDNREDRQWFMDNYPDGAMVAFLGETYAESRNESMDDHWVDIHPLPGDGQATPSCGYIIIPVQDAVNDMTDLRMETYMKSIPAVYCDKDAVDLPAISKQKAGPGAHYPASKPPDGGKLADAFWQEVAPQLPPDAVEFGTELFGAIPQFLTGLFPAAIGESDAANDTLGGIKLLAGQSKGQAGVAWKKFREGYAKAITQLVRVGAHFRAGEAENGIVQLSVEDEQVEIDLEDLRDGSWICRPDGDESFPNTHAERQQAMQSFVALAGKTPQGLQLIFQPKNLVLIKQLAGLPDLEIPGADSEEKQLTEIKELLAETPIPNQQAIQQYQAAVLVAQAQGQQPPPPPNPDDLLLPSIQPQWYDDDAVEAEAGITWMRGTIGQQAARDNRDGFKNVELHVKLHQQKAQQAQQNSVQQAMIPQLLLEKAKHSGQAKSPTESIQYKDLGPSGKMQLAAQAGLDVHADMASDLTEESMGGMPEKPEQKPSSSPPKPN